MANNLQPPTQTSFRARKWPVVTPSDTEVLNPPPEALYATAGDLVLEDYDGNQITLTISEDRDIAYQPKKVLATGTTSTVYALY